MTSSSHTASQAASETSELLPTAPLLGTRGLPFRHALMSHRGGSLEHVENTMPGFRFSANELKADLLELDVQLTKDGQVVIFHDNDMARMCGAAFKGKHIGDFNFDELPPLQIPDKVKHLPDVVSDPESTRIPLLRALLSEFPQYPMQIDVKNGSEELVLKVGHMIQEFRREQLTVWGSFLSRPSKLCYKYFGTSIPMFFSLLRFLKAFALNFIGLLGWMEIHEQALIVPNFGIFISPSLIRALQRRGVSVIVFGRQDGGMNKVEDWEQVRRLGANGICSDAPSRLQAWLKENPLPM
ncbi:Lysophospholipase D gdpd1 [Polyrhizophydium stewartii]|uniref:Lysophospholipase D gdpd1 n=1 Tax=Polyrhizophydium stewartii TaxID=2732419 RepID=A0ABR4NKS3_9FUNG